MTGRERAVVCGDVEIFLEEWGEGPPLVLAHGGEADHGMYRNLAPLLSDRFRVIAYDQRDTGRTVNPPSPYTMPDLGRDLGALIEALGYEKAHVFGTSFGGIVAQNAALERPDRIDRLILSVTLPGDAGRIAINPAFLELAARGRDDPTARVEHQKMFLSRRGREHDWLRLQKLLADIMITRPPEARARRSASVQTHDTLGRLGKIRARTLVIAGEDDEIIPIAEPRALAESIPGARLQIVPGVGHAWTIEQPELAARIITEFLSAP